MPHDARSLVASANFLGSRFVFVIDHIERGVEQVMIVHGAFVRVRGEQFTARDRRLDRNKLVNAFGFESLGEEGLTAIRCDDVLPPVRQVRGTEQDSRVNTGLGNLGENPYAAVLICHVELREGWMQKGQNKKKTNNRGMLIPCCDCMSSIPTIRLT